MIKMAHPAHPTEQALRPETEVQKRGFGACYRGGKSPMPLVPPIYASSTFLLESAKEGAELCDSLASNGYLYTRWGNPTVDTAADVIARLEGAAGTLLFSSGIGAITTCLLHLLKGGGHMVACQPCYGELSSLCRDMLAPLGVEVTWVSSRSIEDYSKAIRANTKVLYGESPANPSMSLLDLEGFGGLGRSLPGVMTIVDSTFATPYLVQPLKYGVDIVLHSCTKYLGGHTDIVGGALSCASATVLSKLVLSRLQVGACMSPFEAFLLHRSLKTLAVRMDRHCLNAMAVAEFLESHPKVAIVHYPGLPTHPDHQLAKRQMKNFSGMISFEVTGGREAGIRLAENVRVITLAVSLGGTESLIEHPASMTHYAVPPDTQRASGITAGLLRLSVGIEDVNDLISDLKQALDKV